MAQGRYTLGVAEKDPDVLALMGQELRDSVTQALSKVETAAQSRDVARVDSTEATRRQGDALEEGKLWRRVFASRVGVALIRKAGVPADAARFQAKGKNPQELKRDLLRLVGLGRESLSKLTAVGITEALLERGEKIAAKLGEADQKQELARLAALPAKVREMYVQKALLYLGIKQINLFGRSVHVEDEAKAAQYNLDILYRRQRRQGVESEVPETDQP